MEKKVKIIIAGDLFPTPINYKLFSEGKANDIFDKKVCDIFKSANYRICNLEGCFTDETTQPKLKDGPNIRAPKECINAFSDLGIDCASLANNHAIDYGVAGLRDTCAVLNNAGIKYFGTGEDESSVLTHYTVTLNGKKVTFYGVAETDENVPKCDYPGVNIYDEYRICKEIQLLKTQCDLLVVLYHGGIENIHYNTPSIKIRFHRMADSGADIIISQHTHAIGEEEFYNGAYLLYGQGNFCFHFSKSIHEWVETALLLEVDINDNGFDIKKHVVKRDGPRVSYDKEQDLASFYERSKRLHEGELFNDELKKLADEKIPVYLQAFRGNNILDKFARRIFSKEHYILYLKRQYTQKQILKILLALQCEEFREVSSQGLMNMLDELEKTHGRR